LLRRIEIIAVDETGIPVITRESREITIYAGATAQQIRQVLKR